jgi:hypothetical protein
MKNERKTVDMYYVFCDIPKSVIDMPPNDHGFYRSITTHWSSASANVQAESCRKLGAENIAIRRVQMVEVLE